jgi:hypothetical protein
MMFRFDQNADEPTEFILSANKSTYTVCEPIRLTFTFTNHNEKPIVGHFGLGFDYDQLEVYYRRDDGESRRYHSLRIERARTVDLIYKKMTILPGESISREEILLYDTGAEQFLFSAPGTYEFKAIHRYVLSDPSKVITSNILQVSVIPLPTQESKEMLASWKDTDMAKFVQGDDEVFGYDLTKRGSEKAKEFLDRYRASVYAEYVRERALRYLEKRKKQGMLTEDEKAWYESLRP